MFLAVITVSVQFYVLLSISGIFQIAVFFLLVLVSPWGPAPASSSFWRWYFLHGPSATRVVDQFLPVESATWVVGLGAE